MLLQRVYVIHFLLLLFFYFLVYFCLIEYISYPTSGSMIRPGKIAEFENVRRAIECRYMFEAILDNELLKATQRQIKASLFEFVSDNRTQDKER